jgi:hypothetical protein
MTNIRLDPEAWNAGFVAGKDGEPGTCPYPVMSTKALSWHSGFIEGKSRCEEK